MSCPMASTAAICLRPDRRRSGERLCGSSTRAGSTTGSARRSRCCARWPRWRGAGRSRASSTCRFVGTPVPAHRAAGIGARSRRCRRVHGTRVRSPRVPGAPTTPTSCSIIDAPADDSLFLPSKLIDYLPPASRFSRSRRPAARRPICIRALGYPVDRAGRRAGDRVGDRGADRREAGRAVSTTVGDARGGRAAYDIRRTAGAFADILARCA